MSDTPLARSSTKSLMQSLAQQSRHCLVASALLLVCLASAQTPAEDVTAIPQAPASHSESAGEAQPVIVQKVKSLEKTLSKLRLQLESTQDKRDKQQTNGSAKDGQSLQRKTVDELLQSLPVNASDIDKRIDALTQPDAPEVTQQQVDQAESISQTLNNRQQIIEQHLQALEDNRQGLEAARNSYHGLQQLLSNPVNAANTPADINQVLVQSGQAIEQLDTQLDARQQQLLQQQTALSVASGLLNRWKSALSGVLLAQQQSQPQSASYRAQLDKQLGALDTAIVKLKKQLSQQHTTDLATIESIQQHLYEKQTQRWLTRFDSALLAVIERPLLTMDEEMLESLPLEDLQKQLLPLEEAEKTLAQLQNSLDVRYADLQAHNGVIGQQATLDTAFVQRQKNIAYQRLLIQEYPKYLSKVINAKKQATLFSADRSYLQPAVLKRALVALPDSLLQMSYQVKISFQALWENMHLEQLVIGALAIVVFSALVHWAYRALTANTKRNAQSTASTVLLNECYRLLIRYRYFFICLLLITVLVRVSDIPYPSNHMIRTLVYTVIAVIVWSAVIGATKRIKHGHNYSKISYIVMLLLALFVILYAVAYMSAVKPEVLSLYEKGLMLAIGLFVWVERQKALLYFNNKPLDEMKKVYRAYLGLIKLLPWALLGICSLNLIGYSHLAWEMLRYIGVGLLYSICLGIGLQLINYSRKKTKLYCLRHFKHGAFIASDMVSPLSAVSKVLWLWATTAILFSRMGWGKQSYVIANFINVVQYPLLTVGETIINLQIVALTVLALYVIFKTARWIKTFSYHWLFGRIHDLGLRGSLAIFSQYVAIVVGVLISLNVLGIDLTSLAVFAGALGVGVGLGLQDIAKNFISGILLLIERPLRNGDWVNIDGNEGTVTSIGMRAITIETFDKQEVIIPNGNAISSSFTNNTHSDSILRTVLYVGAGYASDPEQVLTLIRQILTTTDGVLSEPNPLVVLWKYDDSCITYRLQYYINIDESGLFSMRTCILSRIWHEFKANEIEIPFPQRDIHLYSDLATMPEKASDA